MADLLQGASEWLDGMRKTHASRLVEYRRGGMSVWLSATFGQTEYELADDYGLTVTAVATDVIVSAADLVLAGQITRPQRGDRIVSDHVVYEVMDLGGGGHYRPCDAYGTALRIHTKKVDVT